MESGQSPRFPIILPESRKKDILDEFYSRRRALKVVAYMLKFIQRLKHEIEGISKCSSAQLMH